MFFDAFKFNFEETAKTEAITNINSLKTTSPRVTLIDSFETKKSGMNNNKELIINERIQNKRVISNFFLLSPIERV
jgi:hypothetical protein